VLNISLTSQLEIESIQHNKTFSFLSLLYQEMDAIHIEYEDQIEKIQDDQKEELEKLRKENEICSLLLESYKKIRDQNCDLTLELAGGKTLEAHKTILIGKSLIFKLVPPYNKSLINPSSYSFSSSQFKTR
jgi:hypothetical protein